MKKIIDSAIYILLIVNVALISWSPVKILTGISTIIFWTFIIFSILKRRLKLNSLDTALIIFTISILVSCTFSINIRESFSYFEKLILKPLALYFAIKIVASEHKNRKNFLFLWLMLSYTLIYLTSLKVLIKGNYQRFSGIFKTPTKFGKFLDLSVPVFIGHLLNESGKILSVFYSTLLLLGILYLVLSGTRGSWISIFLSTILLVLMIKNNPNLHKRYKTRIGYIFCCISAILILSIIVSPKYISKRLNNLIKINKLIEKDYSIKQRFEFYKTALVLFTERPLTGWGFGRKTPRLVKRSLGQKWFSERKLKPFSYHAHNTFLEILFECGLIGFISYIYLLFNIFVFLKFVKFEHISALDISNFISIIAILIHSLVTYYFQTPIIYMFFCHLGFLSTCYHKK